MTGRICGTGSYIPPRVLTNQELTAFVETSDEWIRERTGVARRHLAEEDTTAVMAAKAGIRALADAGMNAAELDLILVSTMSPDRLCPSTACEVQRSLGAKNAVCFDLNAACTGFLFAYMTAQAYIRMGLYWKILLIGAESLSNLVDWTDRGTCILFGDGAGAVVLCAEDEQRLFGCAAHSDGERSEAIICNSRNQKKYTASKESETEAENTAPTYIRMDGRAVFQFAVKEVPEVIKEVLQKTNIPIEEIEWFVLHQANRRIVEAAARRLGVGIDRFPMNLEEYGNTSAASIPILLDEMNQKGMLKRGQKIMLAGFGAGLSWGAALLEW